MPATGTASNSLGLAALSRPGGVVFCAEDAHVYADESGATEFNMKSHGSVRSTDPIVRVQPEAGKALVFVHRVLHRGAPVADGRKYVMRTDVMCSWVGGK